MRTVLAGIGGLLLAIHLGEVTLDDLTDDFLLILILASLAMAGIVMCCTAVILARRSFQFAIAPHGVSIQREGIFGRQQWHFVPQQLQEVAIGDSGTIVNNRTLYQVQLFDLDGQKLGLMTDHDHADLSLVVTSINQVLVPEPMTAS